MSFVGKAVQSVGNAVGSLLGAKPASASAPAAVSAPTPTPSVATPAVQAAADSARMRERAASGRASTMLTSQSDLGSLTPTVGRATLGGKLTDDQRMGTAKLLGR